MAALALRLLFLFTTFPALATITIDRVTGASNTSDLDETAPIIYGGIGGSATDGACSSTDGVSTCNNCTTNTTTTAFTVCNTARIYPGLTLRIEFKSSSSAGTAKALDGTTVVTAEDESVTSSTGSQSYIEIKWSQLCNLDTGSTDCSENISEPLLIGIDSDNDGDLDDSLQVTITVNTPDTDGDDAEGITAGCGTSTYGICGWTAFPGDEKVSIIDVEEAGDFPTSPTALEYDRIRVFYSATSFADATPAGTYSDLDIEEDSEGFYINGETVSGLTNDSFYFFRIGLVDLANNTAYTTSDTGLTDAGCTSTETSGTVNDTSDSACPYIAKPDEVFGLLTEDMNCFISTAAYGSSLDKHIQTFREFRNRYLLTNKWGRRFVEKYYSWGPQAARWLMLNPEFKPIARAMLWPAYAMAWLSLEAPKALNKVRNQVDQLMRKTWDQVSNAIFPVAHAQTPGPRPVEETPREQEDDGFSDASDDIQSNAKRPVENPAATPKGGYRETNKKQFIQHPQAEKGLIKIQKDGTYRYKVKQSPLTQASSFRIGMFTPENLFNPDTDVYFTDIYSESQTPIIIVDWQWIFFRKFGKLAWKVETGLFASQGNGRFEDPAATETPLEMFTFVAFPSSAGVNYRAQFWDKQPIVPYAEGGLMGIPFFEFRDDDKPPKLGGAGAAFASVGGSFNLSMLDLDMLYEMDREYGINATWFSVEFRQQFKLSRYDFSGTIVSAGFHFEF